MWDKHTIKYAREDKYKSNNARAKAKRLSKAGDPDVSAGPARSKALKGRMGENPPKKEFKATRKWVEDNIPY